MLHKCWLSVCCGLSGLLYCCRWTVGDASIFSVDDGKRLAQTPHKPLTFYERIRLEKQQMAALETPLVQGYRLLPEFTPGRAMFWGSIIAVWGTAALVMSAAKSLDIKTVCVTQTLLGSDRSPSAICTSLHPHVSGLLYSVTVTISAILIRMLELCPLT